MALRKASIYKKVKRPYTRKSRVKGKSFIKTIPPKRIVKFVMGDIGKQAKGKFAFTVNLVSKEAVQLRDNSIEAARQLIKRHLELNFGADYYFAVSVYPHHVLREHKIAAVAQSDRYFAGMSHSFGKPAGISAQVKPGTTIFRIEVSQKSAIPIVRGIYRKAAPKIGCNSRIEVEELHK